MGIASHVSLCSVTKYGHTVPERRETHERQETDRLQHPVRGAGRADGGRLAADGAVLRHWPSGQRQAGEGRGRGRCGISAKRIPRRRWVLSPEPAADEGLLPHLRERPKGDGGGHDHRLDAEHRYSGSGTDAPGESLVHLCCPAVWMVQTEAGGADRVRRPFGYPSRLGAGSVLYSGKQCFGVCER